MLAWRDWIRLPGIDFRNLKTTFVRLLEANLALVFVEWNILSGAKRRAVLPALEFTAEGVDLVARLLPGVENLI